MLSSGRGEMTITCSTEKDRPHLILFLPARPVTRDELLEPKVPAAVVNDIFQIYKGPLRFERLLIIWTCRALLPQAHPRLHGRPNSLIPCAESWQLPVQASLDAPAQQVLR
jgi:hypothetical protein